MTTENYSMLGLEDLLNDLHNLNNFLMLPSDHYDAAALQLLEDSRSEIIEKLVTYMGLLKKQKAKNKVI